MRQQLDLATFTARGFTTEQSVVLGETIAAMWGDDQAKVSFAPSGADAIEIALSVAKACTGRHKTISFYDAYHGRSVGTLSVGGQYTDRRQLEPLMPGALHIPPHYRHGDEELGFDHEIYARHSIAAMQSVFQYERDIAAVIGETIRNGAYAPPDWYWPEVRELCNTYGALLILDEVPTGLGKTGWLFNHERFNVRPDITVVGKALGGAIMPIAGAIVDHRLNVPSEPELGYFTHEKNTMSARAGLTTLEIIRDENLVSKTKILGETATGLLVDLMKQHPSIREIRSAGLMLGIDFGNTTMDRNQASNFAEMVYRASVDAGIIPIFPSGSSVTLSMPLIIEENQLIDSIHLFGKAVQIAESC
jgi:4-aminobutyrate aminotransferase